MVYLVSSNVGIERAPSGFFRKALDHVGAFARAWAGTSAAYVIYQELSRKSDAQLAARGLRREDIGRAAVKLELVRK